MPKVTDPSVVEWLDQQPAESVWITSITLFEARLGLALLPNGRRRQALELAFEQLLAENLEERVLDFDSSAAEAAAGLAAERQRKWPNRRHARHADRQNCNRSPCDAGNQKRQTLCRPSRGRESLES
jgi:predicted nucleic acid-binding protein